LIVKVRKFSTWIEGSWKDFGIRHPGPPAGMAQPQKLL
jgi:hypothetical protein